MWEREWVGKIEWVPETPYDMIRRLLLPQTAWTPWDVADLNRTSAQKYPMLSDCEANIPWGSLCE